MSRIYLLLIGILTITISQLSISVDLVGWIIYTPFLIYLRKTSGVKSRLLLVAALITGWSFCIAKIVSPPMPLAMVFLYSIPISIFHLPGFLVWDKWKDERWSALLFPTVITIMEWVQYSFTPLASWGVAAYSQSHSLPIMQAASLFGMAGLSFMIYWVNIAIAEKIANRTINWRLPITVSLLLLVFGALRVDLDKSKSDTTIRVAAVGTDSDITGLPLPSKQVNESVKANLFARTAMAAQGGSKLVVWNEASTFILPGEENGWRDSLTALSKRLHLSLVAAYIVPTSTTPLRYQNKYLFFDSTGGLLYTYNKHQPVPGEQASKGKEAFKVFDIAGVKTGAAICYDYDFPYIAKALGKLNADVVAVPSSDWRGIDPLHSRMAAFRAVEQGHSIIRSTRFGLSAAITPYGEMVAQISSYDENNKLMIADLPAHRITTLYSIIGDGFVYCCMGLVLVLILYYFDFGQFQAFRAISSVSSVSRKARNT